MPTVSYEDLYGLAVAIYEAAGATEKLQRSAAKMADEKVVEWLMR